MGESALKSHMEGKKHIALIKNASSGSQLTLTTIARAQSSESHSKQEATQDREKCYSKNSLPGTSSDSSISQVAVLDNLSNQCLGTNTAVSNPGTDSRIHVGGDAVLGAETLWAIKTCVSHFSTSSSENVSSVFRKMFPDSQIAERFQCGKTKCSYLINHGIAPHVKQLLLDAVKRSQLYVVMFDESLNKITQEKQMDVHVRYWEAGQVCSRYLGSEFMGHAKADDMLYKLKSCLQGLNLVNVLQLSMDGPNVNWKLFDSLEQDLKRESDIKFLNVGSCGLHQVHGAFQKGSKASGWAVDSFLSSCYWLLKDTPARREDFVNATDSDVMPLKFCNHRWLENVPVCERAINLLPSLTKYVAAVASKTCTDPGTKSFSIISQALKDPLLPAKLAAFLSIANLLQPFLATFQTDTPMIPFLHTEVEKVMKGLMERFVKPALLSAAKTCTSIDITKDNNLCSYDKIDIGFSANKILKELTAGKKVSDRQAMAFRMETKSFLVAIVTHLLVKSPLKYSLTKNLSAFDPRLMGVASKRESNKAQFRNIVDKVIQAGRFPEVDADRAVSEYVDFIDNVAVKCHSEFAAFNTASGRVDTLLHRHMASSTSYVKLWAVVKQLLLLSHGQAAVERGFSVNRQVEADNMTGQTLIARRLVCDHVNACGGVMNVDVTSKQLLISCSSARHKYFAHLEDEKKKHGNDERNRKRKCIEDEVDSLRKKKVAYEKDVESLTTDADNLAVKAEKEANVTLITKSNAMRRGAKEKADELAVINQQLDSKLLELKNCQ